MSRDRAKVVENNINWGFLGGGGKKHCGNPKESEPSQSRLRRASSPEGRAFIHLLGRLVLLRFGRLALSVSHTLDSSPKGRAFGKKGKLYRSVKSSLPEGAGKAVRL